MTQEFKDIVDNPFTIGDPVATDVTVNKSSSLRVGTVTGVREEPYGTFVKVSYSIKGSNRSVWRGPKGVVKVAAKS